VNDHGSVEARRAIGDAVADHRIPPGVSVDFHCFRFTGNARGGADAVAVCRAHVMSKKYFFASRSICFEINHLQNIGGSAYRENPSTKKPA
jgi:hypothetical protein